MPLTEPLAAWLDRAHQRLASGSLTAADLDALRDLIDRRTIVRQHLLYLHATTPSIRSQVIAMARHDAVAGSVTQIEPVEQEWPYATVHDAILDGWQVIHFPQQQAPFEDREIDILGYEFILQKLETIDV